MTDEAEELAVRVVETSPRRGSSLQVATQGWGWPKYGSPDSDAHVSFTDAMDTIRKQVDLESNVGKHVATLIVDVETRVVRDWALESSVKEGEAMTDATRPLPSSVSEYMNDRHGATPTEVMDAVEVDERFREQVEHYCAITRFTLFKDDETNDAESLRWDTVEWSDVAEWRVPSETDY